MQLEDLENLVDAKTKKKKGKKTVKTRKPSISDNNAVYSDDFEMSPSKNKGAKNKFPAKRVDYLAKMKKEHNLGKEDIMR